MLREKGPCRLNSNNDVVIKVLNYLPSLTGSLSAMLSCEQKFLYGMAFRICRIVRVAVIRMVGLFKTPPLSRCSQGSVM